MGGYSNWGGEPAGTGHDGETRTKIGFDGDLLPQGPLNLGFSANYEKANAELPYENSDQETREGVSLKANLDAKLSDFTGLYFQAQDEQSQLTTWDQGLGQAKSDEWGVKGRLAFDEINAFINSFSIESGYHAANASGLPHGALTAYQWGWLEGSAQLKLGDDWTLNARLQGQGGSGADLPVELYPSADLFWHLWENSQLEFSYTNSRSMDEFYQTYMELDHVTPSAGFALPTELSDGFSLKWTQKVTDQSIFSLFGSETRIKNYHQWSDLLPGGQVVYIQTDSTVGLVDLKTASASFQYDFDRNLALSAKYQRQDGINQSDGRHLTELPTDQVWVALLKTEEAWDAKIGIQWVSQRFAFATLPGQLAADWTLGASGSYHFERALSVWASVDNLLGETYQLEPGYDEPRFYAQAGIELIF
jgi:hypothetical protein